MSERERWIVYPLLFFALGAAIRDKLLHQVESKEVVCNELQAHSIRCDRIVIDDPEHPGKGLAELASGVMVSGDAGAPARRVGRLVLTDSEGQEIFGLADDFLQMRNVKCEQLMINAPKSPDQLVAGMGSVAISIPATDKVAAQSVVQGFLHLNGQELAYLQGVPVGKIPVKTAPAVPVQPASDRRTTPQPAGPAAAAAAPTPANAPTGRGSPSAADAEPPAGTPAPAPKS